MFLDLVIRAAKAWLSQQAEVLMMAAMELMEKVMERVVTTASAAMAAAVALAGALENLAVPMLAIAKLLAARPRRLVTS